MTEDPTAPAPVPRRPAAASEGRSGAAASNGAPLPTPTKNDIGTARPPVPEPGDRIVDFRRPGPDGILGFYEHYCGGPVLLALLGARPDLIERLVPAPGEPAEPDAPALAVLINGRAEDTLLARPWHEAPGVRLLADDGAVHGQLTGAAEPAAPMGLVLDPTLRLVARLDGDPAGWRERARRALAARPGASAGPVVRGGAPVLIVPHVLEPALCQALIQAWEADNAPSGMPRLVDGKPALVEDPAVKNRRDHTVADPGLGRRLTERVGRRLLPEIRKATYFAPTRFEAFKVVCYEAPAGDGRGGYFRRHRDNTTPDAAHRRFAMTLNLNTGAYEGGELVFPEFGPERYAPPAGAAIVFSCAHLHEALDVTRGRRFAVISFFYGEEEARQRAAFRQRAGTG